jgi:hypothetical protein
VADIRSCETEVYAPPSNPLRVPGVAGSKSRPAPKTLHCVPRGPLLRKHYTSFIATTTSCASPKASHQLRFVSSLISLRSLDHLLLVKGPSRLLPLRVLRWMLGPLPRRSPWCAYPFLPMGFGLPLFSTGSATNASSVQRLLHGHQFRGCSHSFMFRPPTLLATQVVPTAAVSFSYCPCSRLRRRVTIFALSICEAGSQFLLSSFKCSPSPQGSRDVYFRASWNLLPRSMSDMLGVRIG